MHPVPAPHFVQLVRVSPMIPRQPLRCVFDVLVKDRVLLRVGGGLKERPYAHQKVHLIAIPKGLPFHHGALPVLEFVIRRNVSMLPPRERALRVAVGMGYNTLLQCVCFLSDGLCFAVVEHKGVNICVFGLCCPARRRTAPAQRTYQRTLGDIPLSARKDLVHALKERDDLRHCGRSGSGSVCCGQIQWSVRGSNP